MVTERCNLRCSYCFHTKTPGRFDLDTAKAVLDKLRASSEKGIGINFFGGEPMLEPQLVLDVAKYARTLWKDARFMVCTNGTYFFSEMFKQYHDLGFRFQISIDGDEETTLENRIGLDWEVIMYNVQEILRVFPQTTVRATVTPKNVYKLASNMKFLASIGFLEIMHHIVIEADWKDEDIKEYGEQLKQLYFFRRTMRKKGVPLDFHFIRTPLSILMGFKEPEESFCGAGKYYIAIMPNGDVYPCHRAASNKIFKLGNILTEAVPIIRGKFLSYTKNSIGCAQNCKASAACHACFVSHHLINGDIAKPVKAACKVCSIEQQLAEDYVNTEIQDIRDQKIDKIIDLVGRLSQVVIDVADQSNECIGLINKHIQTEGTNVERVSELAK
jgi:uncharacterized protein